MNVIFFTQGETLRVFYDLMLLLKEPLQLEKVGFVISDSHYYRQFRKEVPAIESGAYVLFKEWEVMKQAETRPPDLEKLKSYQNLLKVPSLWAVAVADRRLMWGANFAFRQDYKPRFNHTQVLSILTENFKATEALFDEVQPDFVVSFICTRVSEYAAQLFSQAKEIPFLNLRPTRILSYMVYGKTVFEPSELIEEAYQEYQNGFKDPWLEKAKAHIARSRKQKVLYEGTYQTPPNVLKLSASRLTRYFNFSRFKQKFAEIWQEEYYYRVRGSRCDRHVPGYLIPLLYQSWLNPRLLRKVNAYLDKDAVTEAELPQMDYVFFPLHKEPEVLLLVQSRPFVNQIEVIRHLAYSLPVGMQVVVKEHPTSQGKRPLNYYQKLKDILNVRFAKTEMDTRPLILHSKCVATIAGSTGVEALILGKPVLRFGRTPYDYLPDSMVQRAEDLDQLEEVIADLMTNHHHDEQALIAFIAASMRRGVAVNWYSTLLGKNNDKSGLNLEERDKHIRALADYTISTLKHLQTTANPYKKVS